MYKYPHLFTGLELQGEQYIELKDNAKPFCQAVPRRAPVPLLKKGAAELNKMVVNNVIEPVMHLQTGMFLLLLFQKQTQMSGSS